MNGMDTGRQSRRPLGVTGKLLLSVLVVVLAVILVQMGLNTQRAHQRNEADEREHLATLFNSYHDDVRVLERASAALATSFADRGTITRLLLDRDREGLLDLLSPVFETLQANYDIVHLYVYQANGVTFLRVHDPEHYGDSIISYRRTNVAAMETLRPVAGIELDPDRLGVRGVAPILADGELIGLIEVGLDYDQAFLDDLRARTGADYTIWVSFDAAAPTGLWPQEGDPPAPSAELFYYASTTPHRAPIAEQVYLDVLDSGEPQTQFVTVDGQPTAVLVAPLLGYGDRSLGILEIATSRAETLAALARDQQAGLLVTAGVGALTLVLMSLSIDWIVLRALRHLTTVTRRRGAGDLRARVEMLPQDELGQLGRTFNAMADQSNALIEDLERQVERVKQADAALLHERDLLHALMDHIPDAIYFKDTQSRFTRINRWQANNHLGIADPADAVGKTDFDFFSPEHAREAYTDEQRIVATGQPLIDKLERVRTADGSYRWVSATKVPIFDRDGQVSGIVGISRDMTERRQSAEALRISEERLRAILEAADHVAFILAGLDPQLQILEFSRGAEHMFGYTRQETLGRPAAMLYPPNEAGRLAGWVDTMRERGEGISEEKALIHREGHPFPAQVTAYPVYDGQGTMVALLQVIQDLTEAKQAERERELLQERLLQAQKMDAIGRLAGGVAHDFNNILTAIQGYTQFLIDDLAADDPATWPPVQQLRTDMGEVQVAAERAAALTQQLLAFSRKQMRQPRLLNLNDVLVQTEKMLRRLIGEDIELVTWTAPDLDAVIADRAQIEQVILNLAVNARDAMPEGGKLSFETANVTLDETYVHDHPGIQPGRYVLLAVSDNGLGMSAEVKAHLFEPFFTTKEKGKGTGLGLATVYGIVEQNGGRIEVYSELGLGTTFKIYLPWAMSDASGEAEAPVPVELPRGSETILVVEDESTVRGLITRTLSQQGYTVLEAERPDAALALLQTLDRQIDMLITDVVMPGMSGKALAEQLVLARPTIKVLYVSGYTDNAIVHHGVLDAGVHFVQKPFTPSALALKVREILG